MLQLHWPRNESKRDIGRGVCEEIKYSSSARGQHALRVEVDDGDKRKEVFTAFHLRYTRASLHSDNKQAANTRVTSNVEMRAIR